MLAKLAKSKRHKVDIAVPTPTQPKRVKRTGPTRPDEYLNEAAKERQIEATSPPASSPPVPEPSEAPAQSAARLALVEGPQPAEIEAHPTSLPEATAPAPTRPVAGATAQPAAADALQPMTDRAQEAAALTRILKGDVGYYQTLWELRDDDDIVSLPHATYASLFALRIGAISPLVARLLDVGAIEIARAYDRRTQTTWAYRIAQPAALAAKAPPVKAP